MNLLLFGAVAGGLSGAFGHLVANKIHGDTKVQSLYPIYSAIFFGLAVLGLKLLS